jgi:hypothetical protein
VDNSSGFTRSVEYTIVRARCESANHCPSGSRRLAGMAFSSTGDLIGSNTPRCAACQSDPASTAMKRSARVASPSAARRSISTGAASVSHFTCTPVSFV